MLERRIALPAGPAPARAVPAEGPAALLPLRASGLTFAVDGRPLIDRLEFTIDAASLTVIMGPNGAGKSLLLRLLHGLIQPSAGTIRWGVAALDERVRRRQAMVFQRPVLLRRSVAANLDFVLGLCGRAGRMRREALLAKVDLLEHARQPARRLSGGEQQRLALARALALEPEVLFLDEPTASLDPASVQMIERIVLKVQRRGTKVIFVTHDLGQAKRLADEILFLHRGRLQEQSPAAQFFTDPASAVAKAYLEGRIVL
jgi:tungstate transport system ATP-binding protein